MAVHTRLSGFVFPILLLLSLFVPFTLSSQLNREACQHPTPNPLDGCPKGTIPVGPNSTYATIQSAILSLPHNNASYVILIQPGQYREQVNVTRPGPVTLLGISSSPKSFSSNTVEVIWSSATNTSSFDNAYTSTLTVAPTLNSSLTGSGTTGNPVPADTPFGNTNFRAYNLNFTNDFAPYSAGPALALSVSYANTGFYYTSFKSYQDTIYVGKIGNAYFKNSEIGGQTDFFYGFGTAWIETSNIVLRGCGGGITAWKGTNTTFVNKYGIYISNSSVRKENSSLSLTGKCALGRPWNNLHRSVFAKNYLDDSIRPSGYIEWSSTDPRVIANTTMAEYKDYGPGFNLTGRLAPPNVTRLFDDAQWAPYSSPEEVFQFPFTGKGGNTAWIDSHA